MANATSASDPARHTPATPAAERLHIALFGRRNSGKSSLINALTGQDVAVVADTPGTTTDAVGKAVELRGIGACLLIDTPGFDDEGELGALRVERTLRAVERADMALVLCGGDGSDPDPDLAAEREWVERLRERKIPLLLLLNKIDRRTDPDRLAARIERELGSAPVAISTLAATGMEQLRRALLALLPEDFDPPTIVGSLIDTGDTVLLVMPQDAQAPRGRLILPQVQTIRELLDRHCTVVCCTADGMPRALAALARPPKLIITDSQVFPAVYALKPEASKLTSFSVLFAAYKGDIRYYAASAPAIDRLGPTSRVLIAEACTHAPATEDIGRVKIPRMLRARAGETLTVDIVSGADFPADLTAYDLIIHCGGCMFNRRHVLSRIDRARRQGVPVTNYGIAIAWLTGILDKIAIE